MIVIAITQDGLELELRFVGTVDEAVNSIKGHDGYYLSNDPNNPNYKSDKWTGVDDLTIEGSESSNLYNLRLSTDDSSVIVSSDKESVIKTIFDTLWKEGVISELQDGTNNPNCD